MEREAGRVGMIAYGKTCLNHPWGERAVMVKWSWAWPKEMHPAHNAGVLVKEAV